jgi:hypothetical protein
MGGEASRARRVVPARPARAARAGAEMVLLHLERGVYFTLNETGAFLWERIAAGATLGELSTALAERYAVAPERAWSDLVALVAELEIEGLVELSDGEPARGDQ